MSSTALAVAPDDAPDPSGDEAPSEAPPNDTPDETAPEDAGFTLDPVVVTATRDEQALSTAPASVSVVTGEDLQRAPVGDLSDALREVPGVSLTAGSQGRREISLRGMDGSYTLLLIDGKRVSSSEAVFRHNDFDSGLLPVEAIERIEVVRGSMSSLYGSEALGGVVNIITKPIADVWTGGLDLQGQTPTVGAGGQEGRASAYVSGPLVEDRLAVRLTGTLNHRRIWNGHEHPDAVVVDRDGEEVTREDGSLVEYGDLATLEGRNDHNGRASFVFTPADGQRIQADYGYAWQTRQGEYFIGNSYADADAVVHRHDAILSHEGRWGWGTTEVRGYWEGVRTGDDGLTQDNLVADGHATAALGEHDLTVGFEARSTALRAEDEFVSGKASAHQEAVYAQGDVAVTDWMSVLVGARADHHEFFGLRPTPRAYLVLSPTDALTVKGGVGTGFKAPTLRQLSDESLVRSCRGSCLIAGNPDLEPETSTNVELGVLYNEAGFRVSATGFRNEIRNLIDTPRGEGVDPVGVDEDSGLPMFVPRNVNRARVQGLEAGAGARLGEVLDVSTNWTWLDARDLDEDVVLDNRPRHTVNGRVGWDVLELLHVFARGQYVGTQQSGDVELPPYTLFDAGFRVDVREGLGVRGGVLNVANTRTRDEAGYAFQERGRTVYLGANARF